MRSRQGLTQLIFIGRRQHAHVRNAANKSNVKRAHVGRTIGAHNAGAVQRKHHGQILQSHIVDQLVITTLQEGGVNGHHGFEAFTCQATRKRHSMLFGNAHVKVTPGETLLELDHARAFTHGRGNAHQQRILGGHVAQPLTKHLGEGGFDGLSRHDLLDAHSRVKLARPVIRNRVSLGQFVAIALFGHHVQELRAMAVTQVFQCGDQGIQIMAINGADIVEAKFFKNRGGHDHALGMFFQLFGQLKQGWCVAQNLFGAFARSGIKPTGHQACQVTVQSPHRWRDRHVIVVEHHQHIGHAAMVRHTSIVQGFKSHAGSHRPVANDGHGLARFTTNLRTNRHAQRRRNRCR